MLYPTYWIYFWMQPHDTLTCPSVRLEQWCNTRGSSLNKLSLWDPFTHIYILLLGHSSNNEWMKGDVENKEIKSRVDSWQMVGRWNYVFLTQWTNFHFPFKITDILTIAMKVLLRWISTDVCELKWFHLSYEKDLKDRTKWTQTRQLKSCLVCSKPTFYSSTEIFNRQELTQTDGINGSGFIYFVGLRLWPRELHKKHLFPRGI